jgi:dihydropteroate synthase
VKLWKTSKRTIKITRPLVMGILNVTPDSFSDGGRFADVDSALRRAEEMIAEGADIIDIGGESTRPGSTAVDSGTEINRTAPLVHAIATRFDVSVSIDTTKCLVAKAALHSGAEIINDISGLRFDEKLAEVAAKASAGLVFMHSRGEFETMHSQPPVEDIFADVEADFRRSIESARDHGVNDECIALDVGIGFGKSVDQNVALIAHLDRLTDSFADFPMLVGASRKSFIGKLLDIPDPEKRLSGSLAVAAIAAWNGASILRVHDVRETVETLRMVDAIKNAAS